MRTGKSESAKKAKAMKEEKKEPVKIIESDQIDKINSPIIRQLITQTQSGKLTNDTVLTWLKLFQIDNYDTDIILEGPRFKPDVIKIISANIDASVYHIKPLVIGYNDPNYFEEFYEILKNTNNWWFIDETAGMNDESQKKAKMKGLYLDLLVKESNENEISARGKFKYIDVSAYRNFEKRICKVAENLLN